MQANTGKHMPNFRQRGFSLVEILVSITLSLVVLAGVLAVMYSSKVTYMENDRVARLQEAGPSFALTVNSISKVAIGLTPALEIGSRFDTGSGVILRPYVSGGVSFLPDNRTPLSGTFGGVGYSGTIVGPSAVAIVEAGLQIYESKGWETRIDYRLQAADAFFSQAIGLRAAKHF